MAETSLLLKPANVAFPVVWRDALQTLQARVEATEVPHGIAVLKPVLESEVAWGNAHAARGVRAFRPASRRHDVQSLDTDGHEVLGLRVLK